MKKNLSTVIFIGSIWGITEATLGHFLHTFALGIGWLLWFPIAIFFLNTMYQITKNPNHMLYAAFISALIKMIDIFYTNKNILLTKQNNLLPCIAGELSRTYNEHGGKEALYVYFIFRNER